MLDKIYVVTDLGPGDGGKGGIVHALAKKKQASVIIKRGGAQGSHGVKTSDGKSFNFSQWSCGTFEGIPTHCSPQMVIAPIAMLNEAKALQEVGVSNPWNFIAADPCCICTTPYHMIASQFEELACWNNPRGTIGSGVGQAYRMSMKDGGAMTIRASDLSNVDIIRNKLALQADYYRDIYLYFSPDLTPEDLVLYNENMNLLFDPGYFDFMLDKFVEVGDRLNIINLSEIIQDYYSGVGIVECSHGVLTDAETGFKPHVSAIRTLPCFTSQMLLDAGYNNKVIHLGVHRAYEIRHGAGPMPTYDREFTERMLPGSHKEENRWQGCVRAGAIDLNLMRYALNAAKDTHFDGLCLTWFDQILEMDRTWTTCFGYRYPPAQNESYVEFLKHAEPVGTKWTIKDHIETKELFRLIEGVFRDWEINLPLLMLSVGPTEVDKIYSKNI